MRGLILLATFLASGVAFSENAVHTSTISSVHQIADGRWVLQFDTESPSCTNADSPKSYTLGAGFNGMTAETARSAYAIVLTAFAMGKALQIHFDQASGDCYINSVMLSRD